MKELFGIMLSDEEPTGDYDLYINGKDAVLAKAAIELKEIEEKQEEKRLTFFGIKIGKTAKKTKKSDIKD